VLCVWFRVGYRTLIGGATAFTKVQFETVNGFGTKFYGWGGEDDDMGQRFITYNLPDNSN